MLYFLPTPIGNLADISQRSLELLSSCEILICEDTRFTKKLLHLLSLKYSFTYEEKKFLSLHSHNEEDFLKKIQIQDLKDKLCVFVSDAGMPCISDPGSFLVKLALEHSINYEVLPGANAALVAVAASSLVEKEFTFLAFLPNSGKERTLAISNAFYSSFPVVIYEAPTRILKLVEDFAKLDENRKIFLIKEISKKFERKFFGSIKEVLAELKEANLNGEWVLVLAENENASVNQISQADILALDLPNKTKAKLLAKISGKDSKTIYKELSK